MKKLTVKLLALALVIASIFSFASCSILNGKEDGDDTKAADVANPEFDLDKAKEALEANDYSVYHSNGFDEPGIKEYFQAYNDDSGDHLTIIVCSDSKMADYAYKGQKLQFDYEIQEIELEIDMSEYRLATYEDDFDQDEIDELEDEIEEMKEELEEIENYVIGKKDNIVWYGTERAIEDSKK